MKRQRLIQILSYTLAGVKGADMATNGKQHIGTCAVCGHSHDVHTDGQCGEFLCPCVKFWAGRPPDAWLNANWFGRPLQPVSS